MIGKTGKELSENATFMHNVFNCIQDGISILDKDLNILLVNRTMEKWYAHQMPLTGKKCYEAYHGRSRPCRVCPSIRTLKSGEKDFNIVPYRGPGGKTGWLELYTFPLVDSNTGSTVGVIEYVRDVTEKHRLEALINQSKRLEAIGKVTDGVAHDFMNILTAILAFGETLGEEVDDASLKTQLNIILSAAERGNRLIESLLAFSRGQEIAPTLIDVNALVKGIRELLLKLLGESIELRVVPSDRELPVVADPTQLERVLMNMATNAKDAMPEGGTFTISTAMVELDEQFIKVHGYGKPGKYANIVLEDTGVGMDDDTKEHVFEPFFSRKLSGRGTGLGLSTAYGIIKHHNGYINVDSEPGRGATFYIYLPLVRTYEKHD